MTTASITEISVAQLQQAEKLIAKGFQDRCRGLRMVRAGALWQARGAQGFESYVEETWGISPRHAERLINVAEFIEDLKRLSKGDEPLPTCESPVRELYRLKQPESRVQAWQLATGVAPQREDGAPAITAKLIAEILSEHFGLKSQASKETRTKTQAEIEADQLRELQEAFETIATFPLTGSQAVKKYGWPIASHFDRAAKKIDQIRKAGKTNY